MNYFENGRVIDELQECAKKAAGERVSIQWLPKFKASHLNISSRVQAFIQHYQSWLPEHLKSHNVSTDMLEELRTDIFLTKNHQVWVESYVRDSKGREYFQYVAH
jgi:hypothetical protein